MRLSESQITGFLTQHLKLTEDWKSNFECNPLGLLRVIVREHVIRIYFHVRLFDLVFFSIVVPTRMIYSLILKITLGF